MVKEERIKQETFTYGPITADNAGVVIDNDSGMAINGKIIEVISIFNQNGSLALYESGASFREICRINASSGLNMTYPRYREQLTTGSVAEAGLSPFSSMGPLQISTGSLTSGTNASLTVIMRYI